MPPTVNSAVSATQAPRICSSTAAAAGTLASRAPTPISQMTTTISTAGQNQSSPLIIGGIAMVAASTASAPISVGTRYTGGACGSGSAGALAGSTVGAARSLRVGAVVMGRPISAPATRPGDPRNAGRRPNPRMP